MSEFYLLPHLCEPPQKVRPVSSTLLPCMKALGSHIHSCCVEVVGLHSPLPHKLAALWEQLAYLSTHQRQHCLVFYVPR